MLARLKAVKMRKKALVKGKYVEKSRGLYRIHEGVLRTNRVVSSSVPQAPNQIRERYFAVALRKDVKEFRHFCLPSNESKPAPLKTALKSMSEATMKVAHVDDSELNATENRNWEACKRRRALGS